MARDMTGQLNPGDFTSQDEVDALARQYGVQSNQLRYKIGAGPGNFIPPSTHEAASPQGIPSQGGGSRSGFDPGPQSMPTMGQPQMATPTETTPAPAMEGLQMATPDQTPAAGFQLSGPSSLRQGLGNRRPPDSISGLKVLTY